MEKEYAWEEMEKELEMEIDQEIKKERGYTWEDIKAAEAATVTVTREEKEEIWNKILDRIPGYFEYIGESVRRRRNDPYGFTAMCPGFSTFADDMESSMSIGNPIYLGNYLDELREEYKIELYTMSTHEEGVKKFSIVIDKVKLYTEIGRHIGQKIEGLINVDTTNYPKVTATLYYEKGGAAIREIEFVGPNE